MWLRTVGLDVEGSGWNRRGFGSDDNEAGEDDAQEPTGTDTENGETLGDEPENDADGEKKPEGNEGSGSDEGK